MRRKAFMKYTTLKDSPEFFENTIHLIEEAFEYHAPNSFAQDFYPLMNKNNHNNCHILVDGDKVVAHIGSLTRKLKVKEKLYPFTMYGGIAVDMSYRGQGIFKTLFQEVLELNEHTTFHLLWSDKLDIYKPFGFFPCINQFEYQPQLSETKFHIKECKLKDLSEQEINQLKKIYESSEELRPQRNNTHWNELKAIHSTDLNLIYTKNEDNFSNYFFLNKGQDLTGVIHEYGYIDEDVLKLLQNYGVVWSPKQLSEDPSTLYASLFKIGNNKLFKQFIESYSNIQIESLSDEIQFTFKGESYSFSPSDFLQGVFGPGRFKELNIPYLFIPGMDSI